MGKRKQLTLEEAIELLKVTYARAESLSYVTNKLAWALYQVWREVDNCG